MYDGVSETIQVFVFVVRNCCACVLSKFDLSMIFSDQKSYSNRGPPVSQKCKNTCHTSQELTHTCVTVENM